MEQRLSVITIGANSVAAMEQFYSNVLEWKPVAKNKDIVFYQLNGLLLSICDKNLLSGFTGAAYNDSRGPITLGYNLSTTEAVWSLYDQLKIKGATILKEPTAPPFGGLFFYFTDVEGNILEVASNPFVTLDGSGNVVNHPPIDHL